MGEEKKQREMVGVLSFLCKLGDAVECRRMRGMGCELWSTPACLLAWKNYSPELYCIVLYCTLTLLKLIWTGLLDLGFPGFAGP